LSAAVSAAGNKKISPAIKVSVSRMFELVPHCLIRSSSLIDRQASIFCRTRESKTSLTRPGSCRLFPFTLHIIRPEVSEMAWLIGEETTRKLIDMETAISVVEGIFHDRAAGKMRSLPRRRLKSSAKQLNVMASWQESSDLLCLRAYVGAANTLSLYNGRTGALQAVLNASYLSSLRTGAASGVAAKYLAPANAKVLGLIGPGWQATFQVEAVARVCRLEKILVFGRNPAREKAFMREMKKIVPVPFQGASSVEEIERESDVLVVATDSAAPIVDGKTGFKPEMLLITMGANQPVKHEVSASALRLMDLVVTDDLPTAQSDSGDLIDACRSGVLKWEDIQPLEKIVGAKGFKQRPARILFQSNGIADEDLAVGRAVWERARRKKIKLRKVREI
jgi:ornithine cyclodeaminase/alanine dehydrogenase-like protein (mu-crystallin family)